MDKRRFARSTGLMMNICSLLLLSAGLVANASFLQPDLHLSHEPVLSSYFGVNVVNLKAGALPPSIPAKEWRTFEGGWSRVEPLRGTWNFQELDREADQARMNGATLDIVLGNPPTWAYAHSLKGALSPQEAKGLLPPTTLNDWNTYVQTLAAHFKGKGYTYELINEPNTKLGYSGTLDSLRDLTCGAYKEIRRTDPTALVISSSPAPSGGVKFLNEYLKTGVGKCFDVLGYHFYTIGQSPEYLLKMVKDVRTSAISNGLGSVPIWNTESGYLIYNGPDSVMRPRQALNPIHVLGEKESAAILARCYIVGWLSGLERFYWYSWGDDNFEIVDDRGRTKKAATVAYSTIYSWMADSVVEQATRSSDGTWTVNIRTSHGNRQWIMWNENGSTSIIPNPAWRVHRLQHLDGTSVPIQGRVLVDITPILVAP